MFRCLHVRQSSTQEEVRRQVMPADVVQEIHLDSAAVPSRPAQVCEMLFRLGPSKFLGSLIMTRASLKLSTAVYITSPITNPAAQNWLFVLISRLFMRGPSFIVRYWVKANFVKMWVFKFGVNERMRNLRNNCFKVLVI